jgi:serine/threonine protein kinase
MLLPNSKSFSLRRRRRAAILFYSLIHSSPLFILLLHIQVTKYVEREILNHRNLVHPHIVQFKEVFLTKKYLGITMEYAAGGDMFEYVVRKGGLRESEARWFFQQLIVATDYIHRMVSRNLLN